MFTYYKPCWVFFGGRGICASVKHNRRMRYYYACGGHADNVLAVSHARNRVWGTEYTNSSFSEQQTNYY